MKPSILNSETAVSESIGFILVSGIIVITLGIIFVVGYPVYNQYVDDGHMKNMRESFIILSNNGDSVALHKSPYSASEIKMYGGNLVTKLSGYIDIALYTDVAGTVPGISTNPYNASLRSLEYSKDSNSIAYIGGSVCEKGTWGTMILKEPGILETTNSLVIPLVQIMNTSQVSIAGNGLTRVTFSSPYYAKMSQTVVTSAITGYNIKNVTVTIKGDYANSYGSYFLDHGFQQMASSAGELKVKKTYTDPNGITVYIVPCYLLVEAN